MAEVIHAGPFATPGEERTAQYLRSLPHEWVVICNKLLPVRNGRTFELDFIVIGDHLVFVLDEKSWGGRIHGSDQRWVRADGSTETSPLNKADYLAKVVAGELRYGVSGVPDHSTHFVVGGVVLSAANERPRVGDPRVQDRVFLLDTVVERLQEIDRRASNAPIVSARAAIRQRLYNLQNRPKFARVIQDYEVEEILQDRPRSYRARARHRLTGEIRILSVYDVHGIPSDQLGFYRREFDAVRQLGDGGLALPVGDPFSWSEDFLVLPVERPEGWRSLAAVTPPSGIEDLVRELTLAANCFNTLAQTHARHIVHRALSPGSVYVPVRGTARSARVRFTDFYAARIKGRETVSADLEASAIEDPYAAPEVAMGYALAEPSSDVYSLALTFYERLTGEALGEVRASDDEPDVQGVFAQRWSQLPEDIRADLADLFTRALGPGPMASGGTARPAAAEVESTLRRAIGRLQTRQAEQQGKLDDRYRILRKLGEGTSGRVYLVEDELEDPSLPRRYVVKTFSRADQVIQQAGREFALLKDISAPNVVRLFDHYPPTSNAHLKMAWIPGPTLAEVQVEFPWSEERWWRLADGILRALEVLEQHGILHRDLKPSNIILREPDETPVLVDFGFAIPAERSAEPAGTLAYLPPEAPSMNVPPANGDRYAGAVMLHEALFGTLPHVEQQPGLDEQRQRIRDVLARAASPDPGERFASAKELRAALVEARQVHVLPDVRSDEDAEPLMRQINPWVDGLRGLYRGSSIGNADNRGLDTSFARDTYVPTALDAMLLPRILTARPPAVFLSGNPGDGKTAFLERIRTALDEAGAVQIALDPSGWEYRLGEHTFRSCYDASESQGGLSADEQLSNRLDGLDGDAAPTAPLTVLVAINDGRLADFFDRYRERFPWLAEHVRLAQRFGGDPDGRPWVVDLKRRAFVGLGSATGALSDTAPSVFQKVLAALVAPSAWAACQPCQARAICPIVANAAALRGDNDGGRSSQRLELLVASVHLRHEYHATMRDLRSTLAYLTSLPTVGARTCMPHGRGESRLPSRAWTHASGTPPLPRRVTVTICCWESLGSIPAHGPSLGWTACFLVGTTPALGSDRSPTCTTMASRRLATSCRLASPLVATGCQRASAASTS